MENGHEFAIQHGEKRFNTSLPNIYTYCYADKQYKAVNKYTDFSFVCGGKKMQLIGYTIGGSYNKRTQTYTPSSYYPTH